MLCMGAVDIGTCHNELFHDSQLKTLDSRVEIVTKCQRIKVGAR